MKKWPIAQEKELIKSYLTKTNCEIGKTIGRSEGAVAHKLRILGLKKPYSPTIIKCLNCGKEFQTNPRQVKRGGGKYCSKACSRLGLKTGKSQHCIVCGKEFYVAKWDSSRRPAKYCSMKCYIWSKRFENRINIDNLLDDLKNSRLPIFEYCKRNKINYWEMKRVMDTSRPAEYAELVESKLASLSKRYKQGRQFEYEVRNYYRNKDYFVLRSPASLGPVDLVALKMNEILLIQCKVRHRYLRPKAKELIIELAKSIGAKPMIAYRDKGMKVKLITEDSKDNIRRKFKVS